MNFIEWCNTNSGFVSFLLTTVTIFLSAIAIIISVRVARLPYRRKVALGSAFNYGVTHLNTMIPLAVELSAINIGNRALNIDKLCLAFISDGRFKCMTPTNRVLGGKAFLQPGEKTEVSYTVDEIGDCYNSLDASTTIYVYAMDVEGHQYHKKYGTIGQMVTAFGILPQN